MELTAAVDRDRKILILHVTGTYRRPHDGFEAQHFVIDTFAEYRCTRVLIDLTQAEVVPGIMEGFRELNPSQEVLHGLMRFSFASLYTQITEEERFLENTAVNRGLKVRVFDDREQAIAWLESG